MLRTAIALSLALVAAPVHAASDINKCIDPAGKVEYRNSTCPAGTKSAAVAFPVATGKVIDIRRSSDRDSRESEIKEVPERPRARPPEPVNALPPAPPAKER